MLPDLKSLQSAFQHYLRFGSPILKNVANTTQLSAKKRLDIYKDAYFLRLLESLQIDYPALYAMLGDDEFTDMANAYIADQPSSFRSIRWYGHDLAAYLKKNLSAPEDSWLAELATLEWALLDAFDARDTRIVTVNDMRELTPENWPDLQFKLHPSVRTLSLHWNVGEIWQAMIDEKDCPSMHYQKKPSAWIIWRKLYDVQFRSMTEDEIYLVQAMKKQEKFSEVCEHFSMHMDQAVVPQHVAAILKQFIVDEMVSEFVFPISS